MIAQAREINKAHTTFIDSIIKHEHNGRIHAEINQLRSDNGGTITGRFSYQNPNLQQIPARNKDLGPKIRSLFLPKMNVNGVALITHNKNQGSLCTTHRCINYHRFMMLLMLIKMIRMQTFTKL